MVILQHLVVHFSTLFESKKMPPETQSILMTKQNGQVKTKSSVSPSGEVEAPQSRKERFQASLAWSLIEYADTLEKLA
jgi:hypothetical protein